MFPEKITNKEFWYQTTNKTYGILILINTRSVKNDIKIHKAAVKSMIMRFSLGMLEELVKSKRIKPIPPIVNKKLDASPSIMYWLYI